MAKKANLFAGIPKNILELRVKKVQPSYIKPMLATLTKDYFSSTEWLYEEKFDGVRCLAVKKKGKVSLISRNKLSMNSEYPELVTLLEKQPADNFIVDGEIVAWDPRGVSDFQLLQGRMHRIIDAPDVQHTIRITYCVFDIVYVSGYDIRELPLHIRKRILKRLFRWSSKIRFSSHKRGNGLVLFRRACTVGWEGLMVKRADSSYVSKRSSDWLKFKCASGQELVIGGYTKPKGSRTDFGALLVGYFDDGNFIYAGKVGTGFNYETLTELGKKLRKITTKKCPFSNYDLSTRDVFWVKPQLVAEFEFAQWTREGRLRVGRYKGLREDKNARNVIREKAKIVKIK